MAQVEKTLYWVLSLMYGTSSGGSDKQEDVGLLSNRKFGGELPTCLVASVSANPLFKPCQPRFVSTPTFGFPEISGAVGGRDCFSRNRTT